MALTDCRECGAEVSSEAATCPHCGIGDPAAWHPSSPAPHGGDWDDYVSFKLRAGMSTDDVVTLLVAEGVSRETAESVVANKSEAVKASRRSVRRGQRQSNSSEKLSEGLRSVGEFLQSCGCLLTMFVTVPILLFFLLLLLG